MRSLTLIVAFAASLSAVAATPYTFTKPTNPHVARAAKEQTVLVTFINHTSRDRELVIGDQMYKINYNSELRVFVPVGSSVNVFSETDSRMHGQQLMQVAPEDANRSIQLN